MKTANEIFNEWRTIRPALGNLICYIDGKENSLKCLDEAYQKGVNDGKKEQEMIADETYDQLMYQKYCDGLNDAWEAAKKIIIDSFTWNKALNTSEFAMIFDNATPTDVMMTLSPQEAIEKLREYEEQKKSKITLGDEVQAWDTKEWVKFIACGDIGDETIVGFDKGGGIFEYPASACIKTGKRFTVEEAES